MSNVNNVKCQQCQITTMSDDNNIKSAQICWDLSDNVTMSTKLSKCQSNCQNFNQIVIISNVMCYQSVQIKLAHRLCTDFQYFYSYAAPALILSFLVTGQCGQQMDCFMLGSIFCFLWSHLGFDRGSSFRLSRCGRQMDRGPHLLSPAIILHITFFIIPHILRNLVLFDFHHPLDTFHYLTYTTTDFSFAHTGNSHAFHCHTS